MSQIDSYFDGFGSSVRSVAEQQLYVITTYLNLDNIEQEFYLSFTLQQKVHSNMYLDKGRRREKKGKVYKLCIFFS